MFKFFKKKKSEEDPILKEMGRQNQELEKILYSFRETNNELKRSVEEKEQSLKELGYTDEDLEKIRMKAKLKVVK